MTACGAWLCGTVMHALPWLFMPVAAVHHAVTMLERAPGNATGLQPLIPPWPPHVGRHRRQVLEYPTAPVATAEESPRIPGSVRGACSGVTLNPPTLGTAPTRQPAAAGNRPRLPPPQYPPPTCTRPDRIWGHNYKEHPGPSRLLLDTTRSSIRRFRAAGSPLRPPRAPAPTRPSRRGGPAPRGPLHPARPPFRPPTRSRAARGVACRRRWAFGCRLGEQPAAFRGARAAGPASTAHALRWGMAGGWRGCAWWVWCLRAAVRRVGGWSRVVTGRARGG